MESAAPVISQVSLLLILGSGLALIIGLRSLAGTLFASALLILFCAPFLAAALGDRGMALAAMVILIFILLHAARSMVGLFIGEAAANTMTGALAADVVRYLVRIPALIVRRIFGW